METSVTSRGAVYPLPAAQVGNAAAARGRPGMRHAGASGTGVLGSTPA